MQKTIRQLFDEAALYIKSLGFKVFVSDDEKDTYGYFSDGEHVGYFQQCETTNVIQVATCNKTPGSTGTGLFLEPNNRGVPLEKIDKQYLEKAFQMYPSYFTQEDRDFMIVRKYFDLNDFLSDKRHSNLKQI